MSKYCLKNILEKSPAQRTVAEHAYATGDFSVLPDYDGVMKKGGMTIKLNPKHKGWCTPMTKSTCTGKRRQFAINAKKWKHEEGGDVKDRNVAESTAKKIFIPGNFPGHNDSLKPAEHFQSDNRTQAQKVKDRSQKTLNWLTKASAVGEVFPATRPFATAAGVLLGANAVRDDVQNGNKDDILLDAAGMLPGVGLGSGMNLPKKQAKKYLKSMLLLNAPKVVGTAGDLTDNGKDLGLKKMDEGGETGTKLDKKSEATYQAWRSKLPQNLQYEGDYDLRGLWKENPNVKPSPNVHFTDKYKLPNHPTFSNESKYFNNLTIDRAGRWEETDSSWNYVPFNSDVKQPVTEKKMKGGGKVKQAIITNDPHDPRLRAYSDSTNLYNKGLKDKAEYDKAMEGLDTSRLFTSKRPIIYDQKIQPILMGKVSNVGGGFDTDKRNFTNYASAIKGDPDFHLFDDGDIAKRLEKPYFQYKKPVQPVVYQKQIKKKVDASTVSSYEEMEASAGRPIKAHGSPLQMKSYQMQGKTPVYGPGNSLIGMMGDDAFYPDYNNSSKRTGANQADTNLITNGLEGYLKSKSINLPVKKMEIGGQVNWMNKYE